MVFTSKAVAHSRHGHKPCHPSSGLVVARTAPCRARSHKDPALLLRSRAVAVERRSGRRGSGRVAVVGSRRPAVRDVVVRSGLREDHRSRRAVVEYDDDSHRGAGCTHVVGHGDRSSRRQVAGRTHVRGSLASENGSAHEDVGCRLAA